MLEELVPSFAASVAGELIRKGDPSYDEARRVWNAMVDRRPALILRCRGTADVVSAVNFAREHGLPLSVRGGGHNLAGNAVCDDGLVLDLSLMKEVRVDPKRRVATAQAGVTLREFDVKTQEFGLATPGGIVSGTGLAGLTLGGGFGYAMRTYGLACDNLLGLEVVTADGRVVRANARENQDLFWAARGSGGNFGVVTSLEFKLHSVGRILFGHVIYPIGQAREAFQFFRKFMEGAPDEFNGGPALLKSPEGVPVAAIGAAYFGSIQEGERILRPLREFGTPLLDEIRPTAYINHRDGFDAYYPSGLRNYWKSCFLTDMSDEAIEMMIHQFGRTTSRRPAVAIETLGGAVARVGRDETAFDHRDAPFSLIITASWDDAAEDITHRTWAREVFQAMQPYSTGGVYVNYLQEEADEGRARVESAYGTKYERLAALKRKYDPGNLFRFNQNIRPNR